MGTFRATLELGDPQGHRWEALDVVVDPGASYARARRDVLQLAGFGLAADPVNRRLIRVRDLALEACR